MQMDFDTWVEQFRPTGTPVEGQGCGPIIDEQSHMFETFGSDIEVVSERFERAPNTVWTLLDVDGETYIASGMSFVNRQGYFMTEVPYAADIEVAL